MKLLNMTSDLYEYVLQSNPQEHPKLKELRLETDKLKYARLRSPDEQISFIMFLLKFIRPKNILELGTFTGYSTLSMALATPDDTKIITCDTNRVFPSTGIEIWKSAGVYERIELRLGLAIDTIASLGNENKEFDFIFIDADKENVWLYFEKSLELLTAKGMILVDNVLWRGQVCDDSVKDPRTTALREFNKRLSQYLGINYCLLPIGDGISLITREE